MLRVILSSKNQSLYQLEKSSHLSHATLNDIYNEKYNINKCSIDIFKKLADSLDMTIDSLYKYLSYDDLSLITYDEEFDLYKSNTLQRLKRANEKDFINETYSKQRIEKLFDEEEYDKSLYLLSLIDHLSAKNNLELNPAFDEMRDMKLNKLIVPKSIYLLLLTKVIKISDVYKKCIKTFLNHNIIESEIEQVA